MGVGRRISASPRSKCMIASPAAMKIRKSLQATLDKSDARSREPGRNALFTSSPGSLRKVPAVHTNFHPYPGVRNSVMVNRTCPAASPCTVPVWFHGFDQHFSVFFNKTYITVGQFTEFEAHTYSSILSTDFCTWLRGVRRMDPSLSFPTNIATFSWPSGGAKVRRKEPLPRNVAQIGFSGVVIYKILRRLADQIESEYCARIQMV